MATETVRDMGQGLLSNDAVHQVSTLLFDVLTLLYATADITSTQDEVAFDREGVTSPQSRTTTLLIMAREKTAQAINMLTE